MGVLNGFGVKFCKILENTPLRGDAENDILSFVSTNGEVAQLVEHHVRNVGVESSNLFFSTIFGKLLFLLQSVARVRESMRESKQQIRQQDGSD